MWSHQQTNHRYLAGSQVLRPDQRYYTILVRLDTEYSKNEVIWHKQELVFYIESKCIIRHTCDKSLAFIMYQFCFAFKRLDALYILFVSIYP